MKEKRWKPEYGDTYWYVSELVEVEGTTWEDDGIDPVFYESGNCFKTEAEAEAAAEKVKSLMLSLHEECENLQPTCNQLATNLPKLTAEVFDRPDCPDWARYAAVDKHRNAMWYEGEPKVVGSLFWNSQGGQIQEIPGKFDASDWKNSLVQRPAAKLPDWCKPGAWIYTSSEQYLRINGVSIDLQKIELSNGATWSKQDIIDEAVSARLRSYNAEEIPDLPFEVTERNSNFRTTVVSCQGNKVWLAGASTAISTEELMRDFTAKGEPCGVHEHLENGEWVK